MKKSENTMILLDTEEEYAQLFGEYLRQHREYPWQLRVYTDPRELLKQEEDICPMMLVVSESAYCEELKSLGAERTVLLNESGRVQWKGMPNVNKYQRADMVLRELLEIYLEVAGEQPPRLQTDCSVCLIGVYSPVRRCCQTTFALTISQLLAREHPTLYLNFEHYAGLPELLPDENAKDLADLLYFLTAEGEQFRLRFQTILQSRDGLDYIPAMRAGQNLLSVTAVEWIGLLQKISELGSYTYVVLDLSESMQGLFDILRMCRQVFTLTMDDRVAQCKIRQYEELLTRCEYGDVMQKTRKCVPPKMKRVPGDLMQYTRGDLAEFVRRELAEMERK